MSDAVAFELDGGGTVIIEVLGHEVMTSGRDEAKPASRSKKKNQAASKAAITFEEALVTVKKTAKSVVATFDEVKGPDTIELEFQVGFNLEGNAVIVKGESSAAFKVALTWNKSG